MKALSKTLAAFSKRIHSVLFLQFFLCSSLFAQEASRPNIVLVLADDLGFSDLGSYGSEVATPNIDSLARAGIRFSNYHTASSCAPTRAMLMSGVDSHRAGLGQMPESLPPEQEGKPGYEGVLSQNVVTVARMLADNDYHTYMAGKWHLGMTPELLPSARGFERTYALADTGADNWEQKPYLPLYDKANWFEDGQETTLPEDFYSSEHLINKTIEYIDSNKDDEQPFFAYVAFQAVHIPVQAPREFTEKYLDTYLDGWGELRQRRYEGAVASGVVQAGLEVMPMHNAVPWESLSDEKQRFESKSMAVYAGMIDAMDYHLGRLMDYLRDEGEFDNTVFIFVSDNGAEPSDPVESSRGTPASGFLNMWMTNSNYHEDYETLGEIGSYNMIGPDFASAAASPLSYYKFFNGEGGMRVPLIISGLDSPLDGKVSNAFSFVTDLVPTILQISGTPLPQGDYMGRPIEPLVGKSLVDLVAGSTETVHSPDESIGFELGGNAALYQGDHKIVLNRGPIGDDTWHLYNIVEDPGETNDLALTQADRLSSMMRRYNDYVDTNQVLPVPEGYDQRGQIGINRRRR